MTATKKKAPAAKAGTRGLKYGEAMRLNKLVSELIVAANTGNRAKASTVRDQIDELLDLALGQ